MARIYLSIYTAEKNIKYPDTIYGDFSCFFAGTGVKIAEFGIKIF